MIVTDIRQANREAAKERDREEQRVFNEWREAKYGPDPASPFMGVNMAPYVDPEAPARDKNPSRHLGEIVKVDQCNCTGGHATYNDMGECMYPDAVWVHGRGKYAVIAHCRVVSVSLWDDLAKAANAYDEIARTACGGMCECDHELIELSK